MIKRTEINKRFTSLVNSYIKEGYVFSPTMSGHQGEEMKVDLTNGKITARIRMERFTDYNDYTEGLEVIVELFDKVGKDHWDTLWSGKGKEIFNERFFAIDNRRLQMFTDDMAEVEWSRSVRHTRYKLRNVKDKEFTYYNTDKARRIVLQYVKKLPGCKGKHMEDILEIKRSRFSSGNKGYCVTIKKGKKNDIVFIGK